MRCSLKVSMALRGGGGGQRRSLNGTLEWTMFTLVLAIENNKKLFQTKPSQPHLVLGLMQVALRTQDAQEQPLLSRCNSLLSVGSEIDKQLSEVGGRAVLGELDFPSGSSAVL